MVRDKSLAEARQAMRSPFPCPLNCIVWLEPVQSGDMRDIENSLGGILTPGLR